jgi:pimeloyl-ACP methyl ester carboxylesterase
MPSLDLPSGQRIGYSDTGSGAPVVLLPGSAVDHGIFAPGGQLAAISERFRTIGLDWRGTGESGRDEQPYTADDLVGDVIGALDVLGVERASIVGMSHGSTIAQLVAARYPDRVNGLVLYSTWAHTDEYLRRLFAIWEHLYTTADPQFYGEATLWFLLSREFVTADPGAVGGIAAGAFASDTAATRHAQIQTARINAAHDARELLGGIGVPTLVVAGEQDRTIPAEYSRQAADAIPGAIFELVTGPGSSHAAFLERGDEVNRLTLDFLQKIN